MPSLLSDKLWLDENPLEAATKESRKKSQVGSGGHLKDVPAYDVAEKASYHS